jgi:glutamate synthase (NADPH/NADH) large chain
MLLAGQLGTYFRDLGDERMVSALALVHQRFSTNTFPTWSLAQPFRMICHNGEINTLRGNMNWITARYATMQSDLLGEEIKKIWPIVVEGQSDSASFDNVLELLTLCGYPLAQAVVTMIPEAWTGNPLMDDERRAFYEHHAALMEPWDGPAAIAFTDGRQIGATLDRNGLRPARYLVTTDGQVVLSSEMGVLPIEEARIREKWRLQPGKMLLIDLEEGRIVADDELKKQLAGAHPYQAWLDETQIVLEELPPVAARARPTNVGLLDLQQAFGYTEEDLKFLMAPMATTGQEAVGSMGTDTPISALSSRPKLLATYFKQNFAQVTNPPIDPIREELVMSLVSFIGPRPNLLDPEKTASLKRLEVRQPILSNDDLEKIRAIGEISDNHFQTITLDITFGVKRGKAGLALAIDRLCERAEKAVRDGYNIIILSDRLTGSERVPLPALLATSAVHHHLIHPRRLRRRGDQPLSRLRDAGRAQALAGTGRQPQVGDQALHQGRRQGHPQGHVEDGHLDLSVLLRCPDLRCHRPRSGLRRQVFHRHPHADRRDRARGTGRGDHAPPRGRVRRLAGARGRARCRRRVRPARARRGSCLDREHGARPAARGARQRSRSLPVVRRPDQRAEHAAADHPRPVRDQKGGR